MKRIYFHIDELARDAITASALRLVMLDRGIHLVYGNRNTTSNFLEKYLDAFDALIIPRQMFISKFKNINIPVMILPTEAIGRVSTTNDPEFALLNILGRSYLSGNCEDMDPISSFLNWGSTQKKLVDNFYPELSNKFKVVGHPRYGTGCLVKKRPQKEDVINIGLITRQAVTNDFLGRHVFENIDNQLRLSKKPYYINKKNGDNIYFYLPNMAEDILYTEMVDVRILMSIVRILSKNNDIKIHLKIHPLENRLTWNKLFNKNNFKINIANWKVPFTHWVSDMDYLVGPSSTSFYDACVVGVEPVSTKNIVDKRRLHVKEPSEENNALSSFIKSPSSMGELIEYISERREFNISEKMEEVLYAETCFSLKDDYRSLEEITSICSNTIKEYGRPSSKNIRYIKFLISSFFMDIALYIRYFISGKKEQSSTFILLFNKRYIDSLSTNV